MRFCYSIRRRVAALATCLVAFCGCRSWSENPLQFDASTAWQTTTAGAVEESTSQIRLASAEAPVESFAAAPPRLLNDPEPREYLC